MKIIIGLGNPGKEYENTRHNVGFMAIAEISEKNSITVSENKLKAVMGRGMICGEKTVLVKPLTFMNNSGEAVRAVMDFYKVEPKDMIVIYDDIDLAPGQLRIREKGSAGGHNGMKSVIRHMGTDEFTRIRVGIGAKPAGWDLADYVLGHLCGEEAEAVRKGIVNAAAAVERILTDGISEAMSEYNKKE